jgi:hypothetical protein
VGAAVRGFLTVATMIATATIARLLLLPPTILSTPPPSLIHEFI